MSGPIPLRKPLPPLAPWLITINDRIAEVAERARRCVGICEDPPGSNRGKEIDAWCKQGGSPLGSYWCALWAGAMWLDSGFEMPSGYGSCDRILSWGKTTGRFTQHIASLGSFVVYGRGDDATHIGIIVRTAPLILSIEGNTTVEGTRLERNGTAISQKLVTDEDPILGYIHPRPITGGA